MSSHQSGRTVVSIATLAVGLDLAVPPTSTPQVQPGDPQCLLVDDLVNCSEDVSRAVFRPH